MTPRQRMIAAILASAYPNTQVAPQTFQLIEKLSEDISDELLEAALMLHVSRSPHFPRPAEVRAAAYEIQANELDAPDPYTAWNEVRRAVTDLGHRRTPNFSHPRITATVDRLGWRSICLSENPTAERSRFIQCFEALQARDLAGAVILPGIKTLARQLSAGTPRPRLAKGGSDGV